MGSLPWLIQLLGITQQDDTLGSLRSSQRIRHRDLSCFINDQNVNGFKHIFPRPKPSGPGCYVRCSLRHASNNKGIVSGFLDAAAGAALLH